MTQFTKYHAFVKHLTLKKLFNLSKVSLSYAASLLFRKPMRWGIPVSISVEPTNTCNLSCPQCPVGLGILKRPKGFIDFELYKKIIDQTAPYLLNLFLYFQGEPLLHKNIIDLVKYASQKNIFTGLSTNAQLLDFNIARELVNSGLSYIIISVDGMAQQTYEKYRVRGKVDKVFSAIESLIKAKTELKSSTPAIELQFLVLKHNEHQVPVFLEYCKKNKHVTCKLKSAQIENFSTAHLYVPLNKKYARYTYTDNSWHLKKKLKNRCWRLWNSTVITWDGQVVPCCYDKDARYAFGNAKETQIKDIIKNHRFKTFAYTLLTDRSKIDICTNCNE